MITDRTQKDLYNIVANLAYSDYRRTNPAGGKTANPYTLSAETTKALEMYAASVSKNRTESDERSIKEYLSNITLSRSDLLLPRTEPKAVHN